MSELYVSQSEVNTAAGSLRRLFYRGVFVGIDTISYVCNIAYMTAVRANGIILSLSTQNGGALARICFSPRSYRISFAHKTAISQLFTARESWLFALCWANRNAQYMKSNIHNLLGLIILVLKNGGDFACAYLKNVS